MFLNTNKGVVKAIRNKRIVIELPRGGTFTFKSDRKLKIGEEVCFTIDSVLQKVTDVIPKAEADETVNIAEEGIWAGIDTNIDGLDLEEDDIGIEEENDDPELWLEEDELDEHEIDDTGQNFKGGFDFGCGEHRADVIDPADYFAD